MHANIVGHVSSIFPIACATGATDEKRSATAQMTDFILAGLRGNSLSGGRRARGARVESVLVKFSDEVIEVCVFTL